MSVAVFHPGTQHSWQTATALQDLAALEFYATSVFYQPDRWPYRIERHLPAGLRRKVHSEFLRFHHPALDPAKVRTVGLIEWLERIAYRVGLNRAASWFNTVGNRQFSRSLEHEMGSDRPFAVWGYNSSSLETFRAAKTAGRFTILDRTIGDWRYYNSVICALLETHSDWFHPVYARVGDAQIERDDAEYGLADLILCGSEYCAETVRAHSPVPGVADKVRVLPYCFDEALFSALPPPTPVDRSGPVRFLFVGQIGVRKGVHHVLEAISQLPRSDAELTLVGPLFVPRDVMARYEDRVTYLPTVARSEIPAIMARHHAMVFPTYFEGSSLSLLEGLAAGLALIQTPQAGSGVTEETGICLAKPDTELTLAAMRAVIEDRARLDHYRAHAQGEASNYSFAHYRENIARLLAQHVLLE